MKLLSITLLLVIITWFSNADRCVNQRPEYPYTSPDKSFEEQLRGGPVLPFSQSPSLAENADMPGGFTSNFNDFADISTGAISLFTHTPMTREERAYRNFAYLTGTEPECYVARAAPITKFDRLMGNWYIASQHKNHSHGFTTCEDILYDKTGNYSFNKEANVCCNNQGEWVTIKGRGIFKAPGVIVIYWKLLNAPTQDVELTYSILGTNYKTWVVGYMCLPKSKKPVIVVQTNTKHPSKKTLDKARACIAKYRIPSHAHRVCHYDF